MVWVWCIVTLYLVVGAVMSLCFDWYDWREGVRETVDVLISAGVFALFWLPLLLISQDD
jgi:hypothetical protein